MPSTRARPSDEGTMNERTVEAGRVSRTGGPLLDIRDLSITFRSEDGVVEAVRNVSLQVAHGETLALVGESGSGKSLTALSTVSLLPDAANVSGSVRWKGA